MELNNFLALQEEEQKKYISQLSNEDFNDFIQVIKKKNLKLSMILSSYRQSIKNINKVEESKVLDTKLDIYSIKDNPEQPRKIYTEKQILEKMDSIRSRGLITPISILKKDNEFILIAGQLRLEAFKRLNELEKQEKIPTDKMLYSKIDVFIINKDEYSNDDIAIDSLVENLNRADMNVVDTALALKKIIETNKYTYEELGNILGKSKFYISSYLSIANASQEFLDYISSKDVNQPSIIYLIWQSDFDIEKKKKLVDMYIAGELKKSQLENIKKESNKKDVIQSTNIYEDIFAFKKSFSVKKYEKLEENQKNIVDEKLNAIKKLQDEINNIINKK